MKTYKATAKLTKTCAQEIIWSIEDAATAEYTPDLWEYIADYIECGPIYKDGKNYILNGDDLYDAVMALRSAN